MMNRFARFPSLMFFSVAVLSFGGCGSPSATAPAKSSAPPRLTELTPTQQQQKERADAARAELFSKLTEKLQASLAEVGPAGAIDVCQQAAPQLAQEVSRDGVRIGRTSFQLRNPNNQPPAWATEFVRLKTREPVFVGLPGEKLGALFPIKLLDQCTMCHGQPAQIGDEVLAAIRKRYPEDLATGFAPGDLRGYFWVEVD